jgi:hypothetical protein
MTATMAENPIAEAYHIYRNLVMPGKKMRQAQITAPAVIQAMHHLGPEKLDMKQARSNAREALGNFAEAEKIDQFEWEELLQFLSSVALFLKAKTGRGNSEKPMNKFEDRKSERLTSQQLNKQALEIAGLMGGKDINPNKLKRLSAHIGNAQDKWDALSSLARFYPLRGVPTEAVNSLVTQLGEIDLHSFKELVAQAVIYQEASKKGWEGLK